jgi:hypothetical protein
MNGRPTQFVENDSKTLIAKPCCVVKGCDRPAFYDEHGILLCVGHMANLQIEAVPVENLVPRLEELAAKIRRTV